MFKTRTAAQRYNKRLDDIFNGYKLHREELEQKALETISSALYYDLADTIDSLTDNELYELIECNGDYKKETKLSKEKK